MKSGNMYDGAGLLGGGRAGRGALWGVVEVVGSERRIPACALERLKGHAVAEFCDADNGRIVFLDEFPET